MARNDDYSQGDDRTPYSDEGGPSGHHARTHDIRREEITRPKPSDQGPDEFADDLKRGQSAGTHSDETVPASEDKSLRHEVADLDDDELKRLSVLTVGTPLDQGSVYVDLNDLKAGPFKALGSHVAGENNRYVAKRYTDYEMWDRLVGQGRTPAVERAVPDSSTADHGRS